MIECICAWLLLILGLAEKNPQVLIAAGLFAIASQLDDIRRRGR